MFIQVNFIIQIMFVEAIFVHVNLLVQEVNLFIQVIYIKVNLL